MQNRMTQEKIAALLRQKIGLEANSIGISAIAYAINRCMAQCGLSDIETYLVRLQTSPQELEELIEMVIVPETWFFRDREPFNFLGRYVINEWLPQNPGGTLRVLSIPCATGEEPYSIAIALIEAGLSPKNFCIDAVDISKKSLLKAQRAIYDRNSFRGGNLEFRDRYFQLTKDGYKLSDLISARVNFIHGNLLEPLFLFGKTPYNVIFCRNLLIYFDNSAKEQAIQVLERLLNKQGLLFVGHSETGQILNSRFVSVRQYLTFAYRKLTEEGKNLEFSNSSFTNLIKLQSQNSLSSSLSTQEDIKPNHSNFILQNKSIHSQEQEVKTQVKTNKHIPFEKPKLSDSKLHKDCEFLLRNARKLADQGSLNEAKDLCKTYLSKNSMSAEAYFLLGELYQASSNEKQAEECFNKVIYLEPNHDEALMHLALLKEYQGDLASALVLRQRLQRLNTNK